MTRWGDVDIRVQLKKLRGELKLSQIDFAKRVSVSEASIKNYEVRNTGVPLSFVSKICNLLELNPLFFFHEYGVKECECNLTSEALLTELDKLDINMKETLLNLIYTYNQTVEFNKKSVRPKMSTSPSTDLVEKPEVIRTK
jgi:transcriptional regulator with XRE-family HTH domain